MDGVMATFSASRSLESMQLCRCWPKLANEILWAQAWYKTWIVHQHKETWACYVYPCRFFFFSKYKEDDWGCLTCISGHCLCGECSAVFVSSVLESPTVALPPKCSMCRAEIPTIPFERLLNPDQHCSYLTFTAMKELDPGQKVISCTECTYFEIWDATPNLFWCKNCGNGHCVFCKLSIPST